MSRSSLSILTVLFLLPASSMAAAAQDKKDSAHHNTVTITKIDAGKGAITVKYLDDKGKPREKTYQLTEDIRLLDETGRVANIGLFASGDEALIIETAGKLREVRRAAYRRSGPAGFRYRAHAHRTRRRQSKVSPMICKRFTTCFGNSMPARMASSTRAPLKLRPTK